MILCATGTVKALLCADLSSTVLLPQTRNVGGLSLLTTSVPVLVLKDILAAGEWRSCSRQLRRCINSDLAVDWKERHHEDTRSRFPDAVCVKTAGVFSGLLRTQYQDSTMNSSNMSTVDYWLHNQLLREYIS
jgi:hypothetical protein